MSRIWTYNICIPHWGFLMTVVKEIKHKDYKANIWTTSTFVTKARLLLKPKVITVSCRLTVEIGFANGQIHIWCNSSLCQCFYQIIRICLPINIPVWTVWIQKYWNFLQVDILYNLIFHELMKVSMGQIGIFPENF